MLKRAWKPVAASVATGGAAYYYFASAARQTFEIPVKIIGLDGKPEMTTKEFPLLPMNIINERLKQNASSETVIRPYGVTWHRNTASLASNNPIEDANSHQIVQQDSGNGDYLFFSVFDGHRGPETSQLLSNVLIQSVALELANLASDTKKSAPSPGAIRSLSSLIWDTSKTRQPQNMDHTQRVSKAIENAFTTLDWSIVNAPLEILKHAIASQSKIDPVPNLSKHPLALKTMLPAISGSCALMAIFDTVHSDLYVACSGDSRAVAGCLEKRPDGQDVWAVDALSEDQTGRNPNEVKRIISEHPQDEAENVIRRGRILGGLEPSRAFGDARYKWPAEIQAILSDVFMAGNDMPLRKAPSTLKTPPYVTARPVVTHRKLSFEDPNSSKRFLVIATDGLWDALSSQEVVSLVGGYLSNLKGYVPKRNLPSMVPTVTSNAGLDGKEYLTKSKEGTWAFVDDNISAHLIRNALGGGDEYSLRRLMSIPAPYSRRYRDDITVTVIWWEQGQEENAQSVVADNGTVKAKL